MQAERILVYVGCVNQTKLTNNQELTLSTEKEAMMHCYICGGPSVGMCRQCDRFYCSRHAGRPTGSNKAACKVCNIGAQPKEDSNEADDLAREIEAAYAKHPRSEVVLSQEQAARLLDSLLFILGDSPNRHARTQVAHALLWLARYHALLVDVDSPLHYPARKAVTGLLSAIDDQEYWVRFAVVETLIRAKCLEAIRPILKLWREKGTRAFPSNGIYDLEGWAENNEEVEAEIDRVTDGKGLWHSGQESVGREG